MASEREFPGLAPAKRVGDMREDTLLVCRDGLILIETDSLREARILARRRGRGADVYTRGGALV